jgi:hypothetical protein
VTTADEDRIAARQAEAIRLRVRGKTIREIATELGISVALAHRDVRTAMAATAKEAEENVAEQRGLELSRLERALEVVESVLTGAPDADNGDELSLKALDRLVKIQEQRAKLLGLYAPEKREVKMASVGLDDLDAMRRAAQDNESETCPTEPETTDEPEPSS